MMPGRATTPALAPALALPRTQPASRAVWQPWSWTAALVLGALLVTVSAAVLTAPDAAARVQGDPDLARLLRAMALIKALLVALGAGAVGWRLQRPTPVAFAASYLALVWIAAAATGALWQLAGVAQAAVALHGAGALIVVLAWRDREFLPGATTR